MPTPKQSVELNILLSSHEITARNKHVHSPIILCCVIFINIFTVICDGWALLLYIYFQDTSRKVSRLAVLTASRLGLPHQGMSTRSSLYALFTPALYKAKELTRPYDVSLCTIFCFTLLDIIDISMFHVECVTICL